MSTVVKDIASIILAAGLSKRFGERNKLLEKIEGKVMVERVIEVHVDAGLMPVVVLGHESDLIREELNGLGVTFVENLNYEYGMGTSIAAAAKSLKESKAIGVSICPGDLPWLSSKTVELLAKEFLSNDTERIVIPVENEIRGHPVFFPATALGALSELGGEIGARSLIQSGRWKIELVEVNDSGIHQDVDTALE